MKLFKNETLSLKALFITCVMGAVFSVPVVRADVAATTSAPQSADEASSWQKRHAAKLALVQAGGSSIVFLGDETVQAFEESYGAQNVWNRNWAAAPYSALNLGFAGDRTENVLWRVENGELDGFTARAIVLEVGHNNLKVRGDSVANTVAGVSAVVEAIKAKQPTAKIILCAIVPQYATRDTTYLDKVAQVNEELAKLADGTAVRWCGYDKAFRRVDPGYIRWTGALMPMVNAVLRGDVSPTKGEVVPVAYKPEIAQGAVNADVIVAAKRYVEANADARIVLRMTGNAVVDLELAKYSDGRHVIWCGIDTDEAQTALLDEAAAYDQLPVGPLYPADEGEEIVFDRVDATTPTTRICESSWRGYDWWGDRLARNRDTIKASGGAIDVVFAGDSITHFWEEAGKDVSDWLAGAYSILNCGYGGDQTQNVLWRFRNGELDGYTAKVVMLMIGTNNNGINGYDPANTADGVKACIAEIKTRQPTAKIVLMGYLPRAVSTADGDPAADSGANARNLETMAILREDLKDDAAVGIVDVYDSFLGADGKIPKALMGDYIHPTADGYRIWASAVIPVLKAATGAEPTRTYGDNAWKAYDSVLDGRFDNLLHWSLNAVPAGSDNAYIGKNLAADFTVTFPEGVYENDAVMFDVVAMNGHSVTLDLSETDFRRPTKTDGQYQMYNPFTIRYSDDSKDILTLNPANAAPDPRTAPHAELANTVVTLSQPAQKRITLDFNGGTVNFDSVLGHEWTDVSYPRLYLFNFNNNGWSGTAPVLDSAEITFRNGASLQAHNVCVQGNAATNVLRFSGGTHALAGLRLPGRYDGQNMAERTVTDVVVEDGANLTVDKLLYFDAATAAQRVERIFVKPGSYLKVKAMGQSFGDSQTIVDGGTFEFGAGNQDFNPATPNYDAVRFTARNGGLILANHGGGGLGLYLGKGGTTGKGLAYLDVADATLRTLPEGKVNFYNGTAMFGPGALVDLQGGTLNFTGNTSTPIDVTFDGATVTNKASFSFGGTGRANVAINDTTLVAEADVNFDDATVDVQDSDIFVASGKRLYLGYNGAKSATVTFRSGTVTGASKTATQFEIGWMGTGRLNVYGGTLNLGRLRLGASFTSGTDKSVENVLDVEGGLVNVREDGNGEGICANYNANRTSRIILNGGILRFYRIYKSAGTAYLEANGGTLQLNNGSSNAIRDMNGLFVGPKGLTIDNDGHTVDFTAAFADKADANGEGRLIVKGAGTTKFTGSLAAVSTFVADEGTVDISGLPSDGLGSLVATNTAVLRIDPAKTIALKGSAEFRHAKFAFSAKTTLGQSYDVFSYKTALSQESLDALFDALVTEGLPTGGVAEFSEVEVDGGYVLRATIREAQNTAIDVAVSRLITDDLRTRAADSVTANVDKGATLKVTGKVSKGAFVKTGVGGLELTNPDNHLVGGFKLENGRVTVTDPTQLGGGKDGNGRASLRNGVLRLAGEDGKDYGDLFAFAQEATTDHVIVESAAAASMDIPPSVQHTGGFTKRGTERLTFKVTGNVSSVGGEGTHDHSKGFWSERNSLVYPQLFDETTGLMTNGTFGAFNINEGELRLVGQGTGAAVSTTGDLAIGLPSAGGTAQPGLWLDNVAWTSATWNRHVYIASCINYSTPVVADFTVEPYLVLTNGASLTANSLYVNRLNNNVKTRTRIDVTASTLNLTYGIYPSRGQAGEARATYDFRDNAKLIVGGNGGIQLAREFTMNFDHSLCARDEATLTPTFIGLEPGWASSTQTFTFNLRNGSRFCVGAVTPCPTRVPDHPLTFVFDDSEWIPVSPTDDSDYTFEWAEPEKILIVAENAGLKLPVPADRTWTMNQPVTGDGDLVNNGTGTLVLGTGVAQYDGATRCESGTIDLGGTAQAVRLAGAGRFVNGTVAAGGGIAIEVDDEYRTLAAPVLSGVASAGSFRVNLGRTTENPLVEPFRPITVCTYEGAAPNVSGWRLKGTGLSNVRGIFTAANGVVTVMPEHVGVLMIVR